MVELAFHAGHHLALRRMQHELVVHVNAIDELSACFLAGLHLALDSDPASGRLGRTVEALAAALEKHLTDDEAVVLTSAIDAFSAAGGRVNLYDWVASVERCATRAGLVMCGSLATAVAIVESEGDSPFITAPERLRDLYAFTVSSAHRNLRRELGSALEESDDLPSLDDVG
jgi:hypothetical protein